MVWTNSRNLQNDNRHIKNMINYMLNAGKTEGIIALASNGTPETFYAESRLLVRQWELAKKKDLKTQAISFVTSHEVKQEGLTYEQAKKYLKTDHDLLQKLVGKDKMVLSSIHKANKRGEGEFVEDGYVHIHHLVITINTEQITAPILSTKHDFLWDKVADTFIKAYPEEEKIKRNYRAEMRYRLKYNRQKNEVLKEIKDGKTKNIDNFKTTPYKFTIYDHQKLTTEIDKESPGSGLSESQKERRLNQRKKIYTIETEIDDAIDTVKENYKNGDCKYCNYRQFTYEMKKRGYKTAIKEGHLTVQPYQNTGNTGMIHFKNPKSEPQKFEGYTKEDIELRLKNEGKFKDWTPKHIEIYTVFDTNHQYYQDKARRAELKQAQYKNYCQYRRLARLTDTLLWIAGGDPISSLLVVGLVLLLFTLLFSENIVKKTIKEVAETYQTDRFKKAINKASQQINKEDNKDNVFEDLLNRYSRNRQVSTTIISQPVSIKANIEPKKEQPIETPKPIEKAEEKAVKEEKTTKPIIKTEVKPVVQKVQSTLKSEEKQKPPIWVNPYQPPTQAEKNGYQISLKLNKKIDDYQVTRTEYSEFKNILENRSATQKIGAGAKLLLGGNDTDKDNVDDYKNILLKKKNDIKKLYKEFCNLTDSDFKKDIKIKQLKPVVEDYIEQYNFDYQNYFDAEVEHQQKADYSKDIDVLEQNINDLSNSGSEFDNRLEDIVFNIKMLSEQTDSIKKNEGNKSPLYKAKNEERNSWLDKLKTEYPTFKQQLESWKGPDGKGFSRTFSPKNIVEFYEQDAYKPNKKTEEKSF